MHTELQKSIFCGQKKGRIFMKKNQLSQLIEKAHLENQLGMYFSRLKQIRGATLCSSNLIKDHFWNYATLINTPIKNQEQLIHYIIKYFKAKQRFPAIYLTEYSTPKYLQNRLSQIGFKKVYDDSWLVFCGNKRLFSINKSIQIKAAQSSNDMKQFIKIFYKAYGGASEKDPYGALPKSYGKSLNKSFMRKEGEKQIKYYLCTIKNTPVGIGTLIINHNKISGIYNVGVNPKYRRKKIGTTVSLKAVKDAKENGAKIIYLMTEKNSFVETFYRKIGFKRLFTGKGYVLKPKEET